MATSKKRITVSLGDKEVAKLLKLTTEWQQSKSEIVARLLNRKGRPYVRYREIDIEKIEQCMAELQKINNQISGMANNYNQYMHTINQLKAQGKMDQAAQFAAQVPLGVVRLDATLDELTNTMRGLTRHVYN